MIIFSQTHRKLQTEGGHREGEEGAVSDHSKFDISVLKLAIFSMVQ